VIDHHNIDNRADWDKSPLPPVVACGRLKEARIWFGIRGWRELPRNDRGWKILQWGADHAWMASTTDPGRSVRRWCRSVAPSLSDHDLSELLDYVATSNKSWTHDQSAAVLELPLEQCKARRFRFLGANDDPSFERRLKIKRAKDAARKRISRAKRPTGRKRGRPSLGLSADEMKSREKAQARAHAKAYRARKKAAAGVASGKNPSAHIDRPIGMRTELNLTLHSEFECAERRKRDGAEDLIAIGEGGMIALDGVGFGPPPRKHRDPLQGARP